MTELRTERGYQIGFVCFISALWSLVPSKIIPSPVDIVIAIPAIFTTEGFGAELSTSITLILQAVCLMSVVSLAVAYATKLPGHYGKAMGPAATAFAAGRFNSFVGLPLLLTLFIGNQHWIKVIMLAIGMAVFSVQPIQDIIGNIPRERFDDARALRMNEWQVVWEVVVLGTSDQVMDVLRTSSGMGYMMLPLVEGTFRSEGGIGVFLLQENKYLRLDYVYCAVAVVSLVGIGFDQLWLLLKRWIRPDAFIGKESS